MRLRRYLLIVLAAIIPGSSALAGDGILEINQTCATQTGCFPGDAAGFPVTLAVPGSYRLTSNLNFNSVLGQPTEDFIEITGPRISLDLNGFGIRCGNSLLGTPCTGGGASGVHIAAEAVRVENGFISGMSFSGIETGAGANEVVVERVTVSESRIHGIDLGGRNSIVRNCQVTSNGGIGIQNGNLESQRGSITEGNFVHANLGTGIHAYGTIRNNVVRDNGDRGIWALSNLVEGNEVGGNGGDGIRVSGGALVVRNVISGNTGAGISGSFSFTYRENVINSNQGGTVAADAGSALNAGNNTCNFGLVCP